MQPNFPMPRSTHRFLGWASFPFPIGAPIAKTVNHRRCAQAGHGLFYQRSTSCGCPVTVALADGWTPAARVAHPQALASVGSATSHCFHKTKPNAVSDLGPLDLPCFALPSCKPQTMKYRHGRKCSAAQVPMTNAGITPKKKLNEEEKKPLSRDGLVQKPCPAADVA